MLVGIDDMDGFIAAIKSRFNERQQHTILLFVAIEKSADMTHFTELGTGKRDGCRGLLHGVFLMARFCQRLMGVGCTTFRAM